MIRKLDDWLQRRRRPLVCTAVVYILTYLVLTTNGTYSERPVASGRLRFGLALNDEYVWEPAGARLRPYQINFLGGLYYYFIKLDRKVWHKSRVAIHPPQAES